MSIQLAILIVLVSMVICIIPSTKAADEEYFSPAPGAFMELYSDLYFAGGLLGDSYEGNILSGGYVMGRSAKTEVNAAVLIELETRVQGQPLSLIRVSPGDIPDLVSWLTEGEDYKKLVANISMPMDRLFANIWMRVLFTPSLGFLPSSYNDYPAIGYTEENYKGVAIPLGRSNIGMNGNPCHIVAWQHPKNRHMVINSIKVLKSAANVVPVMTGMEYSMNMLNGPVSNPVNGIPSMWEFLNAIPEFKPYLDGTPTSPVYSNDMLSITNNMPMMFMSFGVIIQ